MTKHVAGAFSVSLALTAAATAQTPAGGEFRVNTYTTNRQATARVAMEPDGDFVVVWESMGQDGSNHGVFGQRFAASGAARGGEFRVNTYTTLLQGQASVAVRSQGDFVVVWASSQPFSTQAIQARRYDSAGNAIGGEFQVNTLTGYTGWPKVGLAADGQFVVCWTSGSNVAARRFDASGIPIGNEFVVTTHVAGYQQFGDVAVEADGAFVAVWQDIMWLDGEGAAIFGQRHDASGNRLGGEFLVNTYTTGEQRIPSVSLSPAGGFVVTWHGPGDGSLYGVFARRFDASGNALGDDFVVNTYTTGYQLSSFGQVAHDVSGNFVVSWISADQDGSSTGIFAQRFSASGSRLGAEFRVNTHTTSGQTRPSVASDSVGNFVIVWDSFDQDGSSEGVYAQRYAELIFRDGFDSSPLSP
jgi:hypothetical protein